jgi:sialate O-acetylesterase
MIASLLPAAVKGAIWYQGESNAGDPERYRVLLPTMIQDWRDRFSGGDFTFLIVHLANFMGQDAEPQDRGWQNLREAQFLATKKLPKVGLALAIDIGDAQDIHPRNKQDVGKRLGLAAQAIAYDQKLVYSGPVYKEMKIDGDKAVLSFDHTGSGLEVKGDKLTGFAICGEDKKFVWAEAKVDGDKVVVSSPNVAKPTAVRYAWANNPVCNLYNKEGLPAVPFRTDMPE